MNKCEDYRKFFEQCPVGLYKTRLKDGLFVEINPFGAKLLGYDKPEDVINKVHSTEHYDESVRNRLKEMLYEDGQVTDFEVQLLKTDGTVVWVSATAMNGDEFIIGSLTDITQRKQMEDEISTLKISHLSMLKSISQDVRQRCEALDKAM
tara:strand:- start:10070 stop:10519 length:450 start_codon:yes stop_codon:yes gene_type:complete